MSQLEKSILKLKSQPKDWTWRETQTLLRRLGYKELQGSGSRVKFYCESNDHVIILHKPHPGNILKVYMVNQLLETLIEKGFIKKDE